MDEKPRLFKTRRAWREWLARNHDSPKASGSCTKKGTGKRSVTYEEALPGGPLFGWIDSTVRPDRRGKIQAEIHRRAT